MADEAALVFWNGTAWGPLPGGTVLQSITRLGLNTAADAANPFAAKLNKALWTARTAAEGGDGDLRYTLNKETAADVLSLLFQTGFSGRAEFGLIGDDNVTLKVSPDGSTFFGAMSVVKDNGRIRFNEPFFTHATINVKGKALTGAGDGYFCFTVTSTNADNTNKGGAVLTCAPYANANAPFMVLGPWANATQHVVYYGGGGWGCPEATHHQFFAGTHQPTVNNGSTLAFSVANTGVIAYRNCTPGTDNAFSLGTSALKWSVVYSNSGTINTSDARLKDDVRPVELGLAFVRQLEPVAFRWKVGGHDVSTEWRDDPEGKAGVGPVAVAVPTPKRGSRTHYGLLAQQVKTVLDAHGVDDFAGWTLADKGDPGSEQGLRYEQFIPVLMRAVQELADELDGMKAAAEDRRNGA